SRCQQLVQSRARMPVPFAAQVWKPDTLSQALQPGRDAVFPAAAGLHGTGGGPILSAACGMRLGAPAPPPCHHAADMAGIRAVHANACRQLREAGRLTAEIDRQYVDVVAEPVQFAAQVRPAQRLRRWARRKLVGEQEDAHQRTPPVEPSEARTASSAAAGEKWRRTLARPLSDSLRQRSGSRYSATTRAANPAASSATSTSPPSSRCMPSTAHAVATTGWPCAWLRLILPLTPAPKRSGATAIR